MNVGTVVPSMVPVAYPILPAAVQKFSPKCVCSYVSVIICTRSEEGDISVSEWLLLQIEPLDSQENRRNTNDEVLGQTST